MMDKFLTHYDWLDITGSNGYRQLDQLLNYEFSPAGIREQLRLQISHDFKFVLVEHG